jgi:Plavaka transposase
MLPTGPKWSYRTVTLTGDLHDENGNSLHDDFELWLRDPVECIKELISNPAFNGSIAYIPERVYTDSTGQSRVYDEMWTADWWWDMQVCCVPLSNELISPGAREKFRQVALCARLSCPQTKHP